MGIIMINCPATGRGVSTGIETIGIEDLPAVTPRWCVPPAAAYTIGPKQTLGSMTPASSTD